MAVRALFLALLAGAALPSLAQEATAPELFRRADKGHCVACHQLPAGAGTRSDLGPALAGARMRELGKPKLRALIQDSMQSNPATVMPPYGRHQILGAGEIDRLADFLHALPDAPPADPVPGTAAPDVDENANAAAAAGVLEDGRKIWLRKFKNGRTLAGCFPNGGKRIVGAYPQYDARLKRVVTLETAINQCLKSHKEALLDLDDPKTMGAVVAYVRSLSEGQKIAVRVPAAAQDRLQEGRRLYFTRMGQQNYACASCHVQGAGKRFAELVLSPPAGQAAHATTVRNGLAVGLQARIRECLERMGAAPFAAGSEELNNVEYFLAYSSNGLPLRANPARPPR